MGRYTECCYRDTDPSCGGRVMPNRHIDGSLVVMCESHFDEQ